MPRVEPAVFQCRQLLQKVINLLLDALRQALGSDDFQTDFINGVADLHPVVFALKHFLLQQIDFSSGDGVSFYQCIGSVVVQNQEQQDDRAEAAEHYIQECKAQHIEATAHGFTRHGAPP